LYSLFQRFVSVRQRPHSNAIDQEIENDSKKIRKESNILLGALAVLFLAFMFNCVTGIQGTVVRYYIGAFVSPTMLRSSRSSAMSPQANCDRIFNHRITTDPLSTTSRLLVPFQTQLPSSTVSMSVALANRCGIVEGFMFDLEIASLIHRLWQDLVIPKMMDHSDST
jgi:hypothetical protein